MNTTITGTQVNYYFICRRKLWLFSRGITFEKYHENVDIGSFIHDTYYNRNKKEIQIGPVKIDFFDNNYEVVHEVKKTSKLEQAALWQLKYYLFFLKQYGFEATGVVHVPEEKKTIKVELTGEDEQRIFDITGDIETILDSPAAPERLASGKCKKCAYYEFCFAE
ncbi:MAG: CRISPR-associated protein Cas4 [Spirochaetales bacterium]|nr:CRISPR-associated protein Cas4 [Spirochaetales bacterium]